MILVDVTPFKLTGKIAEEKLAEVGLIVNRNTIPYDTNPPRVASGIRIGTPAISTRGMNAEAIVIIVESIKGLYSSHTINGISLIQLLLLLSIMLNFVLWVTQKYL